MGPAIGDAQRRLAKSIALGQIQAFGRRTRHGRLAKVLGNIFRIADIEVVISPHGDIASLRPHQVYAGEQWHSIEFDAAEIRKEFPSPPKQSVQEWMLEAAGHYRAAGKIGKREFLVKDCQEATRCTRREALAAYKLLPPDLKLKQGKPPKQPV